MHLEISGQKWAISEYSELADAPAYTCISYAWGKEKIENPLCVEQPMSARVIRAIETAIGVSQSQEDWVKSIRFSHNGDSLKEAAGQTAAVNASPAFWVDALCVPAEDPARNVCLQSMGEIFSSAFQVLVVLGEQCSEAIRKTSQNGKLVSSDLSLLEKEDWVSRAWTYQEAVNSKRLYFAVEGDEDAIVSGHDFLNVIMAAIDAFKEANNLGKLDWEKQRPKLRSLERLLADYLISDFATRSAYQVMSVMDQRISERANDHFYAMIGSITTKAELVDGDEKLDPSEYFMRVCERKGDFSFLYGAAPRDKTAGRRWRPRQGRFPALLPDLITLGSIETGRKELTHLQLDNMYRLVPGAITSDGLKAARWFVEDKSDTSSSEDVATQVLKRLRILGFSGCGNYLEFEAGFFFPQSEPLKSNDTFVVVSHDIHWVTGGPGLLLRATNSNINDFCDVGAFIGRRPKSGDGIKLG
ncbi:HET domain-containing protein [uncultured Pelagimonas sp.]|uniref:HET domain-containing protein n=1 Tax=uncultured Pelagimonas sp. TaxID=1618102 RepID=UPI00261B147F|nr:HET domain-containing protein [uncultured Pelagimonas sp.]